MKDIKINYAAYFPRPQAKKMKKRFTFVYEFLRGGWSFLCIYADTLKEAEEMFWRQMTEFVEITKIECV